jgi:hypothetical protein
VGSKAFGGLNRRLKEKTAESRWFETGIMQMRVILLP